MPYAKKEKSGIDAYDKGDMKTGMKQRRSRKKERATKKAI